MLLSLAYFFEFLNILIIHKHTVDTFNNNPVGISELTIKSFIHLINDTLQGVLLLVRLFRCSCAARNTNDFLLVKDNSSCMCLFQIGIFESDLIVDVNYILA